MFSTCMNHTIITVYPTVWDWADELFVALPIGACHKRMVRATNVMGRTHPVKLDDNIRSDHYFLMSIPLMLTCHNRRPSDHRQSVKTIPARERPAYSVLCTAFTSLLPRPIQMSPSIRHLAQHVAERPRHSGKSNSKKA
jgi:hypothetical protein